MSDAIQEHSRDLNVANFSPFWEQMCQAHLKSDVKVLEGCGKLTIIRAGAVSSLMLHSCSTYDLQHKLTHLEPHSMDPGDTDWFVQGRSFENPWRLLWPKAIKAIGNTYLPW